MPAGDWFVNDKKFPDGLMSVAQEVNKFGCKFGLWFEPEMVSELSVSWIAVSLWNANVIKLS